MKSIIIPILIVVLSISLLSVTPRQLLAQNNNGPAPNHASANNYYLKTAKMYLGLNDFTKAIDALELAILLEPNNSEAQTLLKESKRLLREKKAPHEVATEAEDGLPEKIETPGYPHKDIPALLQKVYAAIEGEQYDNALQMIEVILATDPIHKEALYIKEKVNDIKHQRITESLKTTHKQEKLKSHEYLRETAIPHQEILRFPPKEQWSEISKRTLPELEKVVEENKRKTEQLRTIHGSETVTTPQVIEDALNTIISFEFLDTALKDIIIFVREKTNVNMIIDSDAGNVPVTLKLKDVSLRTAMKYILPSGYEYVIEGDIIHVYKQKMELRVYDVRDILINLDDKEPLEFDITAAATSHLSMRRRDVARTKDPSERIYDLIELIVTTVEPSSWSHRARVIGANGSGDQRNIAVVGQGEGSITARMGQPGDLVIVNSKYVHEQIADLLASLRSSQNLQVSIEARFITVSDKFLEDIGNELFSSDMEIDNGAESIGGNLSGTDVTGFSFNYTILGNVAGFLRAIQESKDSEILTSPRITLSNTQRGNISVVKTTNYVQSTSVSEGIVTPIIGTIPEGTTFDVRPIVSADRRSVHLEVTPSVFQIESITEFRFSGVGTGTTFSGGGNTTANIPPDQIIQLPQVNVSQLSVTVCVPDKGTLMIGGLGEITKNHLTSGIPIVSNIPVLRRLFTRDQKTHDKTNLIILLKPTILIKEEHERNLFGRLTNKTNNLIHTNNKNK
ncbi:MAG: hypothetical protein DCC43_10210 [Candidatus Brocadia sp.]|nr:hypothetical protein [Candidatus Brocadia fulgida]MCC6325541.1 hypothetical protein [Candidatus Brocadia sp.]MCE7912399.1 hypothetical protein [Candidatus Brocadia sp. AMX3]MDG5995498.1 hypothetical protein [Candidatus Brocadia sp.]RIJ97538.1 MAG: hypothetical protein DCC43_10210 [Candidatus Brocadia sp.]